jgi:amidophosphoribosyltransferase
LIHSCPFLNFSRSRSVFDLAGRRAMEELGEGGGHLAEYADPDSDRHAAMVQRIRQRLGLSTLKYQRLDDLVAAIGLPKERLCTFCWDGAERCGGCEASSRAVDGEKWAQPAEAEAAAE